MCKTLCARVCARADRSVQLFLDDADRTCHSALMTTFLLRMKLECSMKHDVRACVLMRVYICVLASIRPMTSFLQKDTGPGIDLAAMHRERMQEMGYSPFPQVCCSSGPNDFTNS